MQPPHKCNLERQGTFRAADGSKDVGVWRKNTVPSVDGRNLEEAASEGIPKTAVRHFYPGARHRKAVGQIFSDG